MALCWYPEISYGGSIYNIKFRKDYKSKDFFLPQESQGTHTTLDILFQSGSQENKEYS